MVNTGTAQAQDLLFCDLEDFVKEIKLFGGNLCRQQNSHFLRQKSENRFFLSSLGARS